MHAECFGELEKGAHPDIAFAALDAADVVAVESGLLGEFFLAEVFGLAQAPHRPPNNHKVFVFAHSAETLRRPRIWATHYQCDYGVD